ncbi:MAG: hypothetical protein ABL984_21685 [Pyrinomonadaceae bacterium]
MNADKTYRTEFHRTFLLEALPEPLTPQSGHLQLFDNYIHETRLRLRSIRVPETKEWTRILQQRFPVDPEHRGEWKYAEIYLNDLEYEHFKPFEGNEIRKNRYFHEFDGRIFAFDIYLGPLWGLNRARVEFDSREDLAASDPPPWAVIEVTNNAFFDDANVVGKSFDAIQAELNRKEQ